MVSSVVFLMASAQRLQTGAWQLLKLVVQRTMTSIGTLTEDNQHFNWEGMMCCMTVGPWPSGIFSSFSIYVF